jgi:Tol biopolymer transport system component
MYPAISADGRYVAFQSDAHDLVGGDRNGLIDVFVRDLLAGATVRASVDPSGGDSNGLSLSPRLSPDGRYVAFSSEASDLVEGDGNAVSDVYRRDLEAGTTARVSVDLAGGDPHGESGGGDMSADGRYVGFSSAASDVVPGDGNAFTDSFVRDMVAGTTVRASVDRGGGDPDDHVYLRAITPDGRYVALWTYADDLIRGDHKAYDVFVRDLQALTTTRATVSRTGQDPNGGCYGGSISDSGRFVMYFTQAQNIVRKDWNELHDVFYRDMTRLPPDPG